MGTILASDIITKARFVMQDSAATRWTDAECLDWLNDGQREIVLQRPEANAVNTTMTLASGTKQSLPSDGISLIAVTRNMSGAGLTTPGSVVRVIERQVLDDSISTWHTDAANSSGEVDHYVFDERDPKTFYVYPQPPATPNGIELIYAALPADIAATTDAISLDDTYSNALLDYLLYRAYSKDSEFSGDGRAVVHLQAFASSLNIKYNADVSASPNNLPPIAQKPKHKGKR